MTCPECSAEMKPLGPWPDYGDEAKIKETFVCEACAKPGEGKVTVRVEPEA